MFQTLKGSPQTRTRKLLQFKRLAVSNPQRISTNHHSPVLFLHLGRRFQTLKGSLQTAIYTYAADFINSSFKPSKDLYKHLRPVDVTDIL
ncbi:MAG: hypothetical protein MjAS7_2018 [Metallosphaera javensis (ex Sakai et al. 2022)]|nr:MAG: hypothetical protein MjAS7_2018 [Metallosphaera javensis (ex Sakai et al. 2022)]